MIKKIIMEWLIIVASLTALTIICGIFLGIYCLCCRHKRKRIKKSRWEPMQLVPAPSLDRGNIYTPKERVIILPKRDSKYKLIPTAQNIVCIHNERAQINSNRNMDLTLISTPGPSNICGNLRVNLPVETTVKLVQPKEQIKPDSVLVIDGSEPPPPYQI